VPESPLHIERIVSSAVDQNCYVAHLAGRKDCVVVDPGLEPNLILEYLDEQGLTPAAILNTHGHADHIAGNADMKDRWPDCPLVIGRGDAPMLADPVKNLSRGFGFSIISPPADKLLDEGDLYEAAGFRFLVREIPGHSEGHIVFICSDATPNFVFGGDVLFNGSIGRTDFPGGSFPQLRQGIHEKLFTLPDDTVVLSGHGDPTTTGDERRTNPFVGEKAGLYGLQ
jgi:glyoxylase-like metal-dependent hydrolase (beta-lactamase superfamily II)